MRSPCKSERLNAYFAYSLVLGQKIPLQTALGTDLISGALFVLLSVFGGRKRSCPISNPLKCAVIAGIGMFLAFNGLKNADTIVTNSATFVTIGALSLAPVLIALFGLVVTSALVVRSASASSLTQRSSCSAVAARRSICCSTSSPRC